jgi:hypothetical protein
MEKDGEYWVETTKEGNENEIEMSDDGEKKNDEMQNKMRKNKMTRTSMGREKDEMPNKMRKRKSNKQI